MLNLTTAILTATVAHDGQYDKCGEPYILHPMRVMMSLQTVKQRIIGVCHDVIEDTSVTMASLKESGWPEDILAALDAITHPKNEPYVDYIERVKRNELAKAVKIADIKDNISPLRMYKLKPVTIERLTKKYSNALRLLEY